MGEGWIMIGLRIRVATALAFALAAFGSPVRPVGAAEAAAQSSPRLTGAEAWEAVVGNSIVGTTPDGPYAEFVARDGTVRHQDRDGTSVGRWRLAEGRVCLLFPEDDEEECRRVEVGGSAGAFLDSDGSRYPFEVLPGNPRNL